MLDFVLEHGVQILGTVAFGLTSLVAMRARKFLKTLTVDKVVDFAQKLVDKYISKDKEELNNIIEVIGSLPFVKTGFDKYKSQIDDYLAIKIDEIDEQILSWQVKIDNGVVSKELINDVYALIERLKKDKERLLALEENTN